MQIGGRWRLENRLESIQVHIFPEFPLLLARIHPAGGALPASCSGQGGMQWSLLYVATGPPTTFSNIYWPSKVGQSFRRLLVAWPASWAHFSINNSVFKQKLQHPSLYCGSPQAKPHITPPTLQEGGKNTRPPEDRENRPPLLPLLFLSIDWGTWSNPPPPPYDPEGFKTLPLSLPLPPLLPVGGNTAKRLIRTLHFMTIPPLGAHFKSHHH